MKFLKLNRTEYERAIMKILSDFGDGTLKAGQYVLDSITRIPDGFSHIRLKVAEFLLRLEELGEVLVIFDQHPSNAASRLQLLRIFGIDEDIPALRVSNSDLAPFLINGDCDLYIVDNNGRLLAVASHEDETFGNERRIWCPIPLEKVNAD